MSSSLPNSDIILDGFSTACLNWIKQIYEEQKLNKNKESHEVSEVSTFNLSSFIKNTIFSLTNQWNETSLFELLPFFFHNFITISVKIMPKDQKYLFKLGDLLRGFLNISEFYIRQDTIVFIKNKLQNGEMKSEWADVDSLEEYYMNLPKTQKKLRYEIRNLIMIVLRTEILEKDENIKDVKLIINKT